ncbi:Chromosome transmission fidelity protein 18-like protein [Yarrowia sp. E02]|nr:Chromosome transmission fidelity protein 18-like protein [Yarrowia sp. E02]
MSLDWGGGLFGSANGSSALAELQNVGKSRDKSRDLNDDSDMDMSDGSDLNMSDDEDEKSQETDLAEKEIQITKDVPPATQTKFPSPEPEQDFISEMLGEPQEESRDESRAMPGSSAGTRATTSSTRYITLYSGTTLSRSKKYIKTTRLRTMQQEEESLKNHYGIDVSGIRRRLVEEKYDEKENEKENLVEKTVDPKSSKSSAPSADSFSDSKNRNATLVAGIGARDSHLWVEKLRPQKLFDLNGHSDRHKDILYWLSEWNSFIFQTPSKAVEFKAKQKEKWMKKSGRIEDAVRSGQDTKTAGSRDRPQKRILLVHGEPGTGKTTACGVLARHLGFNTLEMNASDDRGSEAFRRGVLGPMRSHSVTSKDRPNCVILDEIDGADPIFIDKLVKLVQRDEKEEMWHERKTRHNKKYKEKLNTLISRPIICIANNLHGLLYKLRPHCRIVNYGRLSSSQSLRIVQNVFRTEMKLQKLTSKHNRFLADICSSTDGDIRQAINILQFGTPEADSANNSLVDKSALWSNIVSSLFSHVPVGKERANHVQNLCQKSLRCGEWNKLVFGAFSAYITCLSGAGNLTQLTNISKLSDWYHLYDLANTFGSRDDYHPYTLAAFSLLFGSSTANQVTSVETDYHLTNQTQTQLLRLNDIHGNIPAEMRRYLNKQSLLDDLGMFLDSLAKQQRGVTLEQMSSLAESLTSLGVGLKKENIYNEISSKREEIYVFVPPVCDLSRDQESHSANTAFLESLYKVLTPDPTQKRPGEFSQVQNAKKRQTARDVPRDSDAQPSPSQQPKKPSSSKSSTLLDFFIKEKVEISATQAVRNEAQLEKDTLNTWVSYFEGYSNAVRRDLTWEQLWME